jgi:hypothetical protein
VKVTVLLTAAALAVAGSTTAVADDGNEAAVQLLERAAAATRTQTYVGEVLVVVWDDAGPTVATAAVRNVGGELTVEAGDRWTVQLAGGGGIVDHTQGWHVPLPRVRPVRSAVDRRALNDKYQVRIAETDRILGRDCPVVEITRRADGRLRERLWIDEASALVLRRETYGPDGERLRLLAYLGLDFEPAAQRSGSRPGRSGELPVPLTHRAHDVKAVTADQLQALRASGWTVPQGLPGGYQPVAGYVVDTADSQPLHLLYRDGLYSVSLFQHRGGLDPDDLPQGAEPARGLGWPAWEWPGALPHRLVWEAGGTTFSLVGDAPADELRAIAATLPQPAERGALDRLRRGLQRLWSWVVT